MSRMPKLRRYVALVNEGNGWEMASILTPKMRYYHDRMSDLLSALERNGYDDWSEVGRDSNLHAELASSPMPHDLRNLSFVEGVVVYAGPIKRLPGLVARSAILELHLPALKRLGFVIPYACPVEGCGRELLVPKDIVPDIYTCPCDREQRIFVRFPKYGERPKDGEVFVLEEVRE